MNKLEKIALKYSEVAHNEDNYEIGGGLSEESFASRRHQDAKWDSGKMTLGQATQLFKKATGLSTEQVKEVIRFAVPNMEWHHAGKLPKNYGGGMAKTYFLNSKEIVHLSKNWQQITFEFEAYKKEKEEKRIQKEQLKKEAEKFLKKYADEVVRVTEQPALFHCTEEEMYGKYGFFKANPMYKSTKYYSGFKFRSSKKYIEFITKFIFT